MRFSKKTTSILLSIAMIANMGITPVFASEVVDIAETGITENVEEVDSGNTVEDAEQTEENSTEETVEKEVPQQKAEDADKVEEKEEDTENTKEQVSNNKSVDETVSDTESSNEVSATEETVSDSENVDLDIIAVTDADDISLLDADTTSENSVSQNAWDMLSYSGKQASIFKGADGKYYAVKGTKLHIPDGSAGDKKILKFNKKGVAKVGKSGSTTLISSLYGDVTVNVIDPKISEKKANIAVGESKKISVSGVPEGVPVAWISSDQNVVQVLSGNCVGVGVGKSTVMAYVGGKGFKCKVTVADKSGSTQVVNAGKKPYKLKIKKVNKATAEISDSSVKFEKGKISATGSDKVPVSGNLSDGHQLLIYKNDATPTKTSVNLKIGEKVVLLGENCHTFTDWKSKDSSIAAISEYGVIIGQSAGKTVLSAKVDGKKIKIEANVSSELYKETTPPVKYQDVMVIDPVNGQEGSGIRIFEDGTIGAITNESEKKPEEPKPGTQMFTVTFDTDGGTEIPPITVSQGSVIARPENPKKDGSMFDTWVTKEESYIYDFDKAITKNVNLKSIWLEDTNNDGINDNIAGADEKFRLILDANGGLLPGGWEMVQLIVDRQGTDLNEYRPSWSRHSFTGWYYLNDEPYSANDILETNTTLIAHWKNADNTAVEVPRNKVIFNDGLGKLYIATTNTQQKVQMTDEINAVSEVGYNVGYTFKGWYYTDGALFDPDDEFLNSDTLYAMWSKNPTVNDPSSLINKVCVIFRPMNGAESFSRIIDAPNVVQKPTPDPEWDGHAFLGWFVGNTPFDFDTPIDKETTIVGRWQKTHFTDNSVPNPPTGWHAVTLDPAGGSMTTKYVYVKDGEKFPGCENPTRNDGYTFDYWDVSGTKLTTNTTVTTDMDAIARWKNTTSGVSEYPPYPTRFDNNDNPNPPAGFHTVTLNTDGGTFGIKHIYIPNTNNTFPIFEKTPQKSGYTFTHWDLDGEKVIPGTTTIGGDVVVTARYKNNTSNLPEYPEAPFDNDPIDSPKSLANKWVVKVYPNGGEFGITHIYVDKTNNTFPVFDKQPTRTGYTFKYWDMEGVEVTSTTRVTKDTSIVAHWQKNGETYNEEPDVPSRFDKEDTVNNPDTETYFALTIDLDGGTNFDITHIYVPKNTTFPMFSKVPTLDGFTFDRWEYKGRKVTSSTIVDSNGTVYARWKTTTSGVSEYPENYDRTGTSTANPPANYHTLTVDLQGGSYDIKYIYVEHGTKFPKFSILPDKANHIFSHWELDGHEVIAGTTVITNDGTIIARYLNSESKLEYPKNWDNETTAHCPTGYHTITVNANDNTFGIKHIYVKNGEALTEFTKTPVRDGWSFDYWDMEGTRQFDSTKLIDRDYTMTARWKTPGSTESGGGVSEFPPIYDETPGNTSKTGYWTVTVEPAGGNFDIKHVFVDKTTGKVPQFAAVPERSGYTFKYWDIEGVKVDASTTVDHDTTMTARWQKNGETYNEYPAAPAITNPPADKTPSSADYYHVTVDVAGGNFDITDIYVPINGSGDTLFPMFTSEPTKDGCEFVDWDIDGNELTAATVLTGDTTITARWANATTHVPEYPRHPAKTDNTPDNGTMPEIANHYTVSVNLAGGTGLNIKHIYVPYTGSYGTPAAFPEFSAEPSRTGYNFLYWDMDGEQVGSGTMVTKHTSIVARWAKQASGEEPETPEYPTHPAKIDNEDTPHRPAGYDYTITIDADGGEFGIKHVYLKSGDKLEKFAAQPIKQRFRFLNWQKDGVTYDFDSAVTSDFTLKAKYEFISSGAVTPIPNEPNVPANTTNVTLTLDGTTTNISKVIAYYLDGYKEYRTYDNMRVQPDKKVVLYHDASRQWKYVDKNGDTQTLGTGATCALTVPASATTGATIMVETDSDADILNYNTTSTTGWIVAPTPQYVSTTGVPAEPANDDNRYYTVHFDVNAADGGEGFLYDREVKKGHTVDKPSYTPVKRGYDFDGWYNGLTKYDFSTPVTSDLSLLAHYVYSYYQIDIDPAGSGDEKSNFIEPYPITKDTKTFMLKEPTRKGYTFVGWTGSNGETPEKPVVVDISGMTADQINNLNYEAVWAANTYNVTIDENYDGGNHIGTIGRTFDSTYGTPDNLPTPTRTGYTFAGWFTEATNGTEVTNTTVMSTADDHTIYAHWTADNVGATVVYQLQDLDGGYDGTEDAGLRETVRIAGESDSNVTPEVKNFVGFTAPAAQTVQVNPDGNTTITYKYTRNRYKVNVVSDNNIKEVTVTGSKTTDASTIASQGFLYEEPVTITAVPKDNVLDDYTISENKGYRHKDQHNYSFDEWADSNENADQGAERHIEVSSNNASNTFSAKGKDDISVENEEFRLTLVAGDYINNVKITSNPGNVRGYSVNNTNDNEPTSYTDVNTGDNPSMTQDSDLNTLKATKRLDVWVAKGESVDYDCEVKESGVDDTWIYDLEGKPGEGTETNNNGYRYKYNHTYTFNGWIENSNN